MKQLLAGLNYKEVTDSENWVSDDDNVNDDNVKGDGSLPIPDVHALPRSPTVGHQLCLHRGCGQHQQHLHTPTHCHHLQQMFMHIK